MNLPRLLTSVALLAIPALSNAQQPKIERKDVLLVEIQPLGKLSKVTAQEITFATGARAPAHTHPCPVIGSVASGEIAFHRHGGYTNRHRRHSIRCPYLAGYRSLAVLRIACGVKRKHNSNSEYR